MTPRLASLLAREAESLGIQGTPEQMSALTFRLVSLGLVPRSRIAQVERQAEKAERDSKIYELRSTMTVAMLAKSKGMSKRQVMRIVKEEMERRRAG